MSNEIVLRAIESTKVFGGLIANDKLDISVEKGSIHSLIGPNGSGKTTFLNTVSKIYNLDGGQILVNDKVINKLKPHQVAELGVSRTFQNIRLFGDLNVLENAMVGGHCRSEAGFWQALLRTGSFRADERKCREKAMECIDFVGLDVPCDRKAKSLPYGQQRLLEIARALASSPNLLLLDEPAAGMNPAEKERLIALISKIRDELGVTVFLIEHSMNVVMSISDRVTVINFGRKIGEGTPKEVQDNEEVIQAYLGRRWKKNA